MFLLKKILDVVLLYNVKMYANALFQPYCIKNFYCKSSEFKKNPEFSFFFLTHSTGPTYLKSREDFRALLSLLEKTLNFLFSNT